MASASPAQSGISAPEVYLAHTGERISGLTSYASLAELKADLVRRVDISVEEQVLIASDGISLSRLFAAAPSSSSLAHDDAKRSDDLPVIFVFNRRHIKNQPNNVIPSFQDLSAALPMPERPSVAQHDEVVIAHMLDHRNRYKHDAEVAETIESRCIARIAAANKFLDQMRNQIRALCALSTNLQTHRNDYDSKALHLSQMMLQQKNVWEELLKKFEDHLKALGSVDLHPGLRKVAGKPERNTLLDCVSEARLRDWKEKCAQSLKILAAKVEDVSVRRKFASELLSQDTVTEHKLAEQLSIDFLESVISEWTKHLHLAQDLKTRLEGDSEVASVALGKVQNLIREGRHGDASNEKNSFENGIRKHTQWLKELEGIDFDVGSRIGTFNERQVSLSSFFFNYLARISKLQTDVRELESTVTVCFEAMKKLDDDFSILVSLTKMGDSYQKCLAEISRRKSFDLLFFRQVETFSQTLNRLRAEETKRRKWFMREYGRYLPQELVDLTGRPPACEIQLRTFDPEWAEFSGEVADAKVTLDPTSLLAENEILRSQLEMLTKANNEQKDVPKQVVSNEVLDEVIKESQRLSAEVSTLRKEKDHLERTRSQEVRSLEAQVRKLTDERSNWTKEIEAAKFAMSDAEATRLEILQMLEVTAKERDIFKEKQAQSEALLSEKEQVNTNLSVNVVTLLQEKNVWMTESELLKSECSSRIVYNPRFSVQDMVVFVKGGTGEFEPVSPNSSSDYKLSPETLEVIQSTPEFAKCSYVVGRIVEIRKKKADNSDKLRYVTLALYPPQALQDDSKSGG
eukprot:TRINITY_DN3002_c0_g1_i1.p1 TRINITY_DN3002_c0_g1~~TRINITY_DN3002_c0_g1_i1.p1  ORF type:complete len:801 (-),score=182.34 TRINITY_DN3002_c0_g1_i1:1521-3923(-)